ncbi:type II toxin-antitoxin system VapC family toxin [Halpernia sp. GG3]
MFKFCEQNLVKLYASSLTFATSHYILKKVYSEEKVRVALSNILDLIEIIPVTEDVLRKALKSNHKDFEDAIQIFCAHKIENLAAIVTRDLKNFSTSEIKVLAPEEAVLLLENIN